MLNRFFKLINNPNSLFVIISFYIITSLIFSVIYYIVLPFIEGTHSLEWSRNVIKPVDSLLDCIYFSITSQATVGYGDIVPKSAGGKVVTIIQVIFGYFYIAFTVAFFTAKKILNSDKFNSFLISYSGFSPQKQTESIKKEVH